MLISIYIILGVLEEARFFGIESVVLMLESQLCVKETNHNQEPLGRRDVIDALVTTNHQEELRFQGVNLKDADLSKLDLRKINFKVIIGILSNFYMEQWSENKAIEVSF